MEIDKGHEREAELGRELLWRLVFLSAVFLYMGFWKRPTRTSVSTGSSPCLLSVYSVLMFGTLALYVVPFALRVLGCRFGLASPTALSLVVTYTAVFLMAVGLSHVWPVSQGKPWRVDSSSVRWSIALLLFFAGVYVLLRQLPHDALLRDSRSPHGLLSLLVTVAMAPVVEEYLFRGFVYTRLRQESGMGTAIVVTSLCFVLFHQGWANWFTLFVNSLLFSYAYERTKTLWVPVVGHAAANIVSVLV